MTKLHPLQRFALAAWFLLLVGVGGRVLFAPVRSQTVVPIYRDAAERWTRGDDLYEIRPPRDVFRNPPVIAAAFVPLTWVPERAAGLLWRGLCAAAFLVALRRWCRDGLPRPLTPGETGAVFALAVLPALPCLNNGQVNLLLAALLLLGATATAQARSVAGLWLGLAAGIKLYPVAAALLLGMAKLRLLPVFALTVAGCFAAPFLLEDANRAAGEYRTFLASAQADDRTAGDTARWPRDAFLLLRVWAIAPDPAVYRGVQLGVAAGMAAIVFAVARRTRNPRVVAPLAFHLGCVWMTVFGPATEAHTYTLLGPTAAAVVVFALAQRRERRGLARVGLALAGYALLVSPTLREMFPNGNAFQLLGPHPAGGLLVLAAVVWGAIRRPDAAETGASQVVRVSRLTAPGVNRSHGCLTRPAPPACEPT